MSQIDELLQKIESLEKTVGRLRETEKALRESEEIYRTITQKSFAGIHIVQDGRFRFVNTNAAISTGYTIEELVGKKSDSAIHPEDKENVKKGARAMLKGETTVPHIFRVITKGGEIRWIMETVASITYGGRPAILGNSIDITEYVMAEEKLRESENLYRAIFETTGTATIIIEKDTTIYLANTEFVKMSGYQREEWEGKKSWTEFVVPHDVERMKAYHYLRRIDRAAAPRNYEFGFIDSWGRIRNVILTVDVIPGTQKSVASFADNTEHKIALEKLRASENHYRTIFENTGTATIIIEEDMTISLANTEFETLSGAPKEHWEGKRKWTELIDRKDLPAMMKYHQLRRIDPAAAPRRYQFGLVDIHGNKRVMLNTIAMIPDTKRSVSSLTDITEQKRSEAALHKREQQLQRKSKSLEETNTALKVLLKQREEDKIELEEKVVSNIKRLVTPHLDKLKTAGLASRDLELVKIIETNLTNVISPFAYRLSSRHLNLTPKELQVANLIKEGKTTKEIAAMMGVCAGAISLHRDHIRKKLGLNKKKTNLQSYLDTLP